MAGARLGDDDAGMTEINILPLVDVVLVVLIIFMVTTSYIVSPSIKVTLPDAATGEATAPSSLGITVTAQGALLLDGEPVTEPELRAAVRAAKAENGDVVCLIAGDKDARHGAVTHVIDLVKQEGVAKFAINIEPVETGP
ncbi:MAG: biopolymer transporter ExbD [Deltaproteobacteria bacterium]|nr:biopolymer transporter ExbD [Deltaproteobacteria bacterium]